MIRLCITVHSQILLILVLTMQSGVSLTAVTKPWGNYDGNGGMADGHYCVSNSLSPMTNYSFSNGYWAGLSWAESSPAPGVFNFSSLDTILKSADKGDYYVEVNPLVGQCSPTWLYSIGVEPLIVNWKPPPSCVPPLCVPAGTWNCSHDNGTGCGCDGVYPCNQTFPDYLSPLYQKHQKEWVIAVHTHIISLPSNLRRRVLSVQTNAGSTGDGCAWHGRLYPDQRLKGYAKIENKTVFNEFSLKIHQMYIDIYANKSSPSIALLFNGLTSLPGLWQAVNASSLVRTGYMIKTGSISHNYAISGEMAKVETLRVLLKTELPGSKGLYVRSRGETTLSANTDWVLQPHWTAWALMNWNLAFGTDTWQNNTLIEEQHRMRPVLSFFSQYAGVRQGKESTGAFAMLRDGLDTSDTQRFPEAKFGKTDKGHNLDRCIAILNFFNGTSKYPPKNDAPSSQGCGCSRKKLLGLNDACYNVWPGNYAMFLEQISPDSTSVGVWRIGPSNELFGRYGRSVNGTANAMLFRTTNRVFTGERETVYVRVIFFDSKDAESNNSWALSYSATSGCANMSTVSGKKSGHWVEVRFHLQDAALGDGKCVKNSDIILTSNRQVVFNLIELSKIPFSFDLSPWKLDMS